MSIPRGCWLLSKHSMLCLNTPRNGAKGSQGGRHHRRRAAHDGHQSTSGSRHRFCQTSKIVGASVRAVCHTGHRCTIPGWPAFDVVCSYYCHRWCGAETINRFFVWAYQEGWKSIRISAVDTAHDKWPGMGCTGTVCAATESAWLQGPGNTAARQRGFRSKHGYKPMSVVDTPAGKCTSAMPTA
jgi:hypothetical protein